jgi:glycosyltransferase involved in cell wall biosynthesis
VTGRRVAVLVKRFPRLSESFILNELIELRRQGMDLVVYALMDPGEALVSEAAALLRPEVVYLHDARHTLAFWRRLLFGACRQAVTHPAKALRVLWALISVHRSLPSLRHAIEGLWLARDLHRRGIVHLHSHFAHGPTAIAYMARLAGGPPFSFTAHAKDLYTTLPRNLRIRTAAASFVVTCTGHNAGYLERVIGSRPAGLQVLYHGTDLRRFNPAGRAPEPGRILSVGRLVPKKGYGELLAALHLLARAGVPFHCDLYGGGPLRDDLALAIADLGLVDSVILHGARLQDEILGALRRATVFALAPVVMDDGDRDGIPNVLVEAMAAGVPVVSTRISGIPELIREGHEGLLVEPHDPAALADALRRVLGDAGLAAELAAAARRKVERNFDVEANSRRLGGLLQGEVHAHAPLRTLTERS